MIVFKTTMKIIKKYKFTILLYTLLLVLFTGLNFQTSESATGFVAQKPDILIINHDVNKGVTKNLIDYLSTKCQIKDIEDHKKEDALFYRDVSYIIEIPKDYREDFLNGQNPEITVQSTGDYEASLASMILNKYARVSLAYQSQITDENELINAINDTLVEQTKTEITSHLDTTQLSKASFYFSFLNYSLLAGCVYVLCLVLSSYKDINVHKRTIISSMNYKKFNRQLLCSLSLVALMMWCFYIILSFVMVGDVMFSMNGLLYIANSFVFALCALSIAFLIGHLVQSRNAMNGIINVVALGSSFLCGAFVPAQFLPDSVLTVAHILPSYWYIQSNELIKTCEVFDITTLQPILINMGVIVLFIIGFVLITQVISLKKRKMA